MSRSSQIPGEPLDIKYTHRGLFPPIELHQRSSLFYQESSYSHFGILGVMFIAAIVVSLLPWQTTTFLDVKIKYIIAASFLWGGFCGAAPFWIRNALGDTIIIDPENQIAITKRKLSDRVIPWPDIMGLQVCYQDGYRLPGYQLNLVWQDSHEKIHRHCLLKHRDKRFVISLGKRYSDLFQFELFEPVSASK